MHWSFFFSLGPLTHLFPQVAEDLFVDAEDPACSSWCRYINHDANPNLALKVPKHTPKHTPNTPTPPPLKHTRTPP